MSEKKKVHEGRNIRRFREILGYKQEALAWELGEEWSQKKVSALEQKETIDRQILEQVAAILKIPVEAIQNFDEERVLNIISNTITDNNQPVIGINNNYYPTFNPFDKLIESLEEIKRLNAEIVKVKDEQIALLKGMLGK